MKISERTTFAVLRACLGAAALLFVTMVSAPASAEEPIAETPPASTAPSTSTPTPTSKITIAPTPAHLPTEKEIAAAMSTAMYIGEKACRECHTQEDKHFNTELHGKMFRFNPKTDVQRTVCEACHGPGSLHAKQNHDRSLIIGFTKRWATPIETQNAQCLNCHKGGSQLHWPGSVHARNKVGCADCHNPMEKVSATGLLARQNISETCYQCHQQQRAEFKKRSHMPLPEGKMSCVDCHNPHGSPTQPLLKADSVNTLCYTCHAEKRGPFIWEHAPVRENCLNCHTPHGSNQEKLLVAARPIICQQCHDASVGHPGTFWNNSNTALSGLSGGTPSQRVIGRACQNCHTQIHGSNSPNGAKFQR